MLTSDSSQANTSTDALESKLLNILNQDGGAKHKSQRGGSYEDAASIKKFFTNLKSSGVKVDVKLNNQSMSDFFGLAQTTTELPSSGSATSSLNINDIIGSDRQVGGARKKKGSKKSSKNHNNDLEGGINAGFQAFLNLKKHVAETLGISNGPKAAKVAGAVQKEIKEKHPTLDAVKIAEEGRKHFDANMSHFKQMLN